MRLFVIIKELVKSISIILNLLWLKYTSRYLVAFKQSNSSEQLKYILGNPLEYIVIIILKFRYILIPMLMAKKF